jgi:hypothetical protein
MNEKTKRTAGWAVVVVAMVIATFLGIRFPIPEAPVEEPAGAAIRPVQFRSVNVAQDLTVGGDAAVTGNNTVTGNTTVGGTLTVTGGVTGANVLTTGNQTVGGIKTLTSVLPANAGITVDTSAFTVADTSGNVSTAGTSTVGTWSIIAARTAISVTAGAIITPTGTLQLLTSGGAKTCNTTKCIANGTTTGQLLILTNANASDAITIDGTGANVECKTDKVLGTRDVLSLLWNGADWNCISLSDNS